MATKIILKINNLITESQFLLIYIWLLLLLVVIHVILFYIHLERIVQILKCVNFDIGYLLINMDQNCNIGHPW